MRPYKTGERCHHEADTIGSFLPRLLFAVEGIPAEAIANLLGHDLDVVDSAGFRGMRERVLREAVSL